MRASVASLSKKFISTFFAATLAMGLVPAAAFAVEDNGEASPKSAESADADSLNTEDHVISNEVGEADGVEKSAPLEQNEAEGLTGSSGEDEAMDEETGSDGSNLSIPATLERINEDVALTQPVAQQESTRSYFLAQTLESTKTIPIVSANLPLDKGTSTDVDEPDAEGESSSSQDEDGEDSDESDPPTASIIAVASTVIGSFEHDGIVYAVEPGGETVAVVASDYNKLPETYIENQVLIIPELMTADYIDYYSVTRIADYAFASLTSEAAATRVVSTESNEGDAEDPVEENAEGTSGIIAISIPVSVTSIGDDAFIGADALQFIIVSDNNPNYSMYDGVLYNADQTCLLSIPEGRLGAVRVAPSATEVKPEAFSHCPSVDTLIADPDSAAYQLLEGSGLSNKVLIQAEGGVFTGWEQFAPYLTASMVALQPWSPISSMDVAARSSYMGVGVTIDPSGGNVYREGTQATTKNSMTFQNVGRIKFEPYNSEPRTNNGYIGLYTDSMAAVDGLWFAIRAGEITGLTSDYTLFGLSRTRYDYILTDVITAYNSVTFNAQAGAYYVVWRIMQIFDANGGVWLGDQTNVSGEIKKIGCYSGQTASWTTLNNQVSRTGYTMKGWSLAKNDPTRAVLDDSTHWQGEQKKYYAVWIPHTYKIVYQGNGSDGGSTAETTGCEYGSDVPLASNGFTRTGYTFRCWNTEPDGSGIDYDEGKVAEKPNLTAIQGGTGYLYAQWDLDTSNLTFDLQGGAWKSNETLQDTTTAIYGQAMPGIYRKNTTTKMSVPEKLGKVFAGFYDKTQGSLGANMYYKNNLDSNTTWDKETTDPTTLYAWWDDKTSNLTFNLQGGAWKSDETLQDTTTATYGSAMPGIYRKNTTTKMSVPEKTGKVFAGFYDKTQGSANATMYYTSTLASNQSWNKDTTSGTILYAWWNDKTSVLTFNLQDGSWKSGETLQDTTTATYGQAMPGIYRKNTTTKMSVPEKTGKVFAGFYDKTQGSANATMYYTSTLASNRNWDKDTTSGTILYAWWNNKTTPLKFDRDGGSGGGTLTGKTAIYGSAMPTTGMTVPTKDGYDFQGYYTDKDCKGTKYYGVSGSSITSANNWVEDTTSETTLYAGWSKKGNVAVTLKNDKTGAVVDTAWAWPEKGIVTSESSSTLATKDNKTYLTTSADGWEFKGYYDGTTQMIDDKGKLTASGLAAKPTSATTWISGWKKLDPVAISLVNDKTGKTVDTAYYWPQKGIVLSEDSQDIATKINKTYVKAEFEGYNFTGYYDSGNNLMIDAAGHLTDKGLAAAPSSDTEWTSGFDIKKFTVTWKFNAASGKADVIQNDIAYGSEVTMMPHEANPGYEFVGWELSYPNGSEVDAKNVYGIDDKYTMKDKGNVVFTEKWSRSEYVTVNLADDYLEEPNAIKTIYHWPGKGYVTSESSTDVKAPGTQIVSVPDMTAYGYEFLGWYSTQVQTDNDESKLMIDRYGKLVTENPPTTATWYAHWNRTDCPVDLVASYVPYSAETAFEIENEETYLSKIPHAFFGRDFSLSVENGKISENLLPKRTGYTFLGYYTDKNDEVSVAQAKDSDFEYKGTQWIDERGNLSSNKWNETPAKMEDFTLYAAWRLDECEVTFDITSNVNPSVSEPVTVASAPAKTTWYYGKPKGAMTVASEQTFYRNGYEFGGWYYLDGSDKVLVSDKDGNPTPVNWDMVKTSVTLYPYWTAKTYTIVFDDDFPKIDGLEAPEKIEKKTTVEYDQELDLSEFTPEFFPYTFAGWYTKTNQLFEGTHMTENGNGTKRFTPRGAYASMSQIDLVAHWNKMDEATYTLFWKIPGESGIQQSVHDYGFIDTVKFDGTEAPVAPASSGYRFEGWVEVDDYDTATRTLASDSPYMEGDTIDGWKPISNWNRYFVAKWNTRAFSVSFSTTHVETTESGESWIRNTDTLENWNGTTDALSWEEACKRANQAGSDMSTGITYDVTMPSFVLPDVKRKGQVFEGWKLLDAEGNPTGTAARGIVVDPSTQDAQGMRDLVYVPVFKDALYTIVLDANTFGEEQRFENIPYSAEFTFPYPATLSTGSVFKCWGEDSNTNSDSTQRFYPTQTVKLAPTYNEIGEMKDFGLAHLANDKNEIRLYAVWNNAEYHVDVPLFANLAIDTDRGDVIAGVNTIAPDPENTDKDAIYRIESIRYEPLKNDDGVYAFQREGDPTDKVYLSVCAGLNTGDATDLEHLLYAENIDKDGGTGGEVTYTDASGNTATAKPLLIELGGTTPVVYGRTAPENQASLESVTDADAPYGFVTFSQKSPLTIRYGLYFESDQTRKDFAFNGKCKYQWLLPKNDGANKKTEFVNTENEDYGRGNAWSGNTVDVAKLHYTVSLVSATE